MAKLSDLLNSIQNYSQTYRHPKLKAFRISGLYDLFPNTGSPRPEVNHKWPDVWPYLNEAGIYAFLSDDLEVLYIGKASMNHGLGYRLSNYCIYGDNKDCKLKHKWNGNPKYIVTVAVPSDSKFEAPSLEEYLIAKISTSNNKAGT